MQRRDNRSGGRSSTKFIVVLALVACAHREPMMLGTFEHCAAKLPRHVQNWNGRGWDCLHPDEKDPTP